MGRPAPWRMPMTVDVIRFLVLILLGGAQLAFAQDDDVYPDKIYLINGDRVTGSIKELDRGRLRLKTETMNTVYLNWLDVDYVESDTYLRIALTDGTFKYGRMQKSNVKSNVAIVYDDQAIDIPVYDISGIKTLRIDESLLHQIEGEISAGADYKQASGILLVNLASKLRYREEKYEIEMGLNWNQVQLDENNNTSRADLSGDYTRFLGDRYFWKATTGFERNQELGIDLRSIVGATAGRYLIESPIMQLQLSAGLAGSIEDRINGTSRQSVEGMIRSSYDFFQLSTPMTRLSAQVNIFPGITEKDRLRVNSSLSLRNEFIRDFFWDLSVYSNYDNQSVNGADDADYGIITSLGASF
jgi:hypothetical protein